VTNKIDIKLFELVPIWNNLAQVYIYLTGVKTNYLTTTSKMPNQSFGFSARYCKAGSILQKVEGSICKLCYGLGGMFRFKRYKTKSERTIDSLSKSHWKEAMLFILKRKRFKDNRFRWFDNGDLQSVKMLEDICWIAERTPKLKHWLPTKEVGFVKRWRYNGGVKPSNLSIRLSTPMINGKPLIKLAKRLGVQCSVASDTERFVGKQKKPYNSNYVKCHTAHSIRNNYNGSQDLSRCGSCSACWNQSVDTIYYEIH
tara:strand:+ start:5456 stop:6223 length:768 start_codon:yes stop_codon:yes gene_type:complete